jgi:hypothetical protein
MIILKKIAFFHVSHMFHENKIFGFPKGAFGKSFIPLKWKTEK